MMQKLTILSGLILSASCMVFHQPTVPSLLGVQYDNPNYNFAYEVNDAHTGDIKSQQESRHGDSVLGQYSLLQSDGVRRTVDYRANDHTGFLATVNNQGRPIGQHATGQFSHADAARANVAQPHQQWPAPAPNAAPSPVAVSRTSVIHTFSNSHHPWA